MGYDGPGMARSHPWFKGYNWLDMYNQTAHSPFFQPMCSRLAEESNSGWSEILSTSLEEFLNSEQVCSRTDDDKSLILATCHSIFSNTSEGEEVDSNDAL